MNESERPPTPSTTHLSPGVRAYLESPKHQDALREVRAQVVEQMLHQRHSCSLGCVKTSREGNIIKIAWTIDPIKFNDINKCSVVIDTYQVDVVPDPKNFKGSQWYDAPAGDGAFTLKLSEGANVLVNVTFIDSEKNTGDMVHINVAMPVSSKIRSAIKKLEDWEFDKPGSLARDIRELVALRGTYDAEVKAALQAIKAKNLPPEKEREEIADFNDHLAMVKQKYRL